MPAIDVTGARNGYRVWIGERVYAEFATLSNAARCAAALQALAAIGALPQGVAQRANLRLVSDRTAARAIVSEMLRASVDSLGDGPEAA